MEDAAIVTALVGEFEQAADEAGGAVDRGFAIAGRQVVSRCAGRALADDLSAAFAFPSRGSPDLLIYTWAGGKPPEPAGPVRMVEPWSLPRHSVEVKRSGSEPPVVVRGLLTETVAVNWTSYRPPLPLYEQAAPFLPLLNQWLSGSRLRLLHAGAVGRRGTGVLLAGEGGSGKSTTSLVCAGSGFDYAGDDYVVVDIERMTAHAVYRSGKVHWCGVHRIGALASNAARLPMGEGGEEDKAVFLMEDGLLADDLALEAVVLPRVVPEARTNLAPARRAQAMAALAPSTILQLPGNGQETLRGLRRLCSSLPAYTLELGNDATRAPGLIEELLSR